MIVNYGYKDGSGEYFISVDTEKCDGCGLCVEACPQQIFEMMPNMYDPLTNEVIPTVKEEFRKKLRFICAPCKPVGKKTVPPCVKACSNDAIVHFW